MKKPKCKVDWKSRRAFRFEQWEIDFIKENWNKKSGYEIAELLHRSSSSVYQKGWAMFGKGKTKVRRKTQNKGGFKKGHVPWNKGKKMNHLAKTVFKKGHVPWQTKPIGTVSERKSSKGEPYLFIKTAEHKWELLHRVVWEKHHGEIPPNHCIRFIDGNQKNVDISNLECISREDHMKRNLNREKAKKTMEIKKHGGFINAILNGYNYE